MKKLIQAILKTAAARLIFAALINEIFEEFLKQTPLRDDEKRLISLFKNYLNRRIKGDKD